MGALDQYIPLAGAGCTSGAVFGSGSGGKGMYGPFGGGCRCAGPEGAGEDLVPCGVFGAIADVERRLRGLGAVGFMRLGDNEAGTGVEIAGGDRGLFGLGVAVPLLCVEGGLEDFGDVGPASFCDKDCDRCRNANSEAFFLLS